MKVIQTRHNGHHFRSRLEARWAVFFEKLWIPYLYELEGFDLDAAGNYLPDFFLPTVWVRKEKGGCWIEIKPIEIAYSDPYCSKLYSLADFTGRPVILLIGPPATGEDALGDGFQQFGPFWDNRMGWYRCYSCGQTKIDFQEGGYCICPACGGKADWWHPEIIDAIEAALSYRFERQEAISCPVNE